MNLLAFTEKATNIDLWEKLLTLISKQQEVKFNWVKGHFGHPENERCDELANLAINNNNLIMMKYMNQILKMASKII